MSYRNEFCERFSYKEIYKQADKLMQRLTVDQIVKLSDAVIDRWPDTMPKKRLRARNRVEVARNEIIGRLRRFEKIEV